MRRVRTPRPPARAAAGAAAARAAATAAGAAEVAGTYRRGLPASRSIVHLSVRPRDLAAHWRFCGQTADFVAGLFSSRCADPRSARNSVSTILNEMVENAVKFASPADSAIGIAVFAVRDRIVLQVDNCAQESHAARFMELARDLVEAPDIESRYFETVQREKRDDEASRLGLLTLLHDFGVALGVRTTPAAAKGIGNVSVQVSMNPEEAFA